MKFLFLDLKILELFPFSLVPCLERSRISVWEKTFQTYNLDQKLEAGTFLSRKSLFYSKSQGLLLLGLKNLRFFSFRKNRFQIDQRLLFNKKKNVTKTGFAVQILGRCLLIVKRYFQMYKLRLSFARPQTLRFFAVTGRYQSSNKKTYKSIFSRTSKMTFIFRVHITQYLLFSGMPLLEKSKITV